MPDKRLPIRIAWAQPTAQPGPPPAPQRSGRPVRISPDQPIHAITRELSTQLGMLITAHDLTCASLSPDHLEQLRRQLSGYAYHLQRLEQRIGTIEETLC
jgi:hypothetical protein